jgi:hypothetical protein
MMKKIKLYGKLDLNEIITVDDNISKENLEELLANYVVDNTDWSYEEIDDNNDSIVDIRDGDVALFTTKAYDKATSMIYDILGFTKMPEETLLRLYNKKHDITRVRQDTDVIILRNTGLFDKNGKLIYEHGLYLDEVEDEYFTVVFKDGAFIAKYDDWEISLSEVCDTAVKIKDIQV